MRKLYCALSLALCVFVSGCTTIPDVDKMDPAYVASKATLKRDDFKKLSTLKSITVFYNKYADTTAYEKYYLVAARVDGSSKVSYYLAVDTMRRTESGWAFWKELYDKSGQKFEFASTNRDVVNEPLTGYGINEVCYVQLTREYVESMQNGIHSFKVYGQNTTSTFDTYPNWVKGFLMRVDKEFPTATKSDAGL